VNCANILDAIGVPPTAKKKRAKETGKRLDALSPNVFSSPPIFLNVVPLTKSPFPGLDRGCTFKGADLDQNEDTSGDPHGQPGISVADGVFVDYYEKNPSRAYKVFAKFFLNGITKRLRLFDITINILQPNGLVVPNILRVGQEIKPAEGDPDGTVAVPRNANDVNDSSNPKFVTITMPDDASTYYVLLIK
jgi:hypothetical protein